MTLKNLYCIAGPSGSGKSTLAELLQKKYGMNPVVSFTTRPMRDGEKEGIGHFFVTEAKFRELKEDLVAYTEINGYKYGVTREMLDQADLYVIDLEGIDYLEQYYKGRKIIVLGINPGPAQCIFRMQLRGDNEESIEERVEHDWDAFEELPAYTNVMLDSTLEPEQLAEQAWSIIQGYEGTGYDRVVMLLQEYIANDYEGSELDYIQGTVEDLGFTKKDIKTLGLDWIYPGEEEVSA